MTSVPSNIAILRPAHSVLPMPDYGVQLAPYLNRLPLEALPVFLAHLEAAGAYRYHYWAADLTGTALNAHSLLECAEREAQIQRQIDALYDLPAEQLSDINSIIPRAVGACHRALVKLPVLEQIRLHADAERQSAATWRQLARQESNEEIIAGLELCANLDEATAECLDELLQDSVANMIGSR